MKIILAGVAGFAVGYIVCKKQLEEKYMRIANEEAAAATQFYKMREASMGDSDEQKKLEDAVSYAEKDVAETFETADAIIAEYQGVKYNEVVSKLEHVDQPKPPKVPMPSDHTKAIIRQRDESKPFIITDEEFLQGDANYEGYTLTWYAGDNVLVSQSDKVIEGKELEATIGSIENLQFGELSNDDHIVYIRSHILNMDFEVARSHGKYSVEVLGL